MFEGNRVLMLAATILVLLSNAQGMPGMTDLLWFLDFRSPVYSDELVLITDDLRTSELQVPGMMISGSRNPNGTAEHLDVSRSTVVFVSSENTTTLIQWIRDMLSLPSNNIYLILWPGDESPNEFENLLESLDFRLSLNSDVYWLYNQINNKTFNIWETYSVKGHKIVQRVSLVSATGPLSLFLQSSKWQRRDDFHAVTVVGTSADDDAYEDDVKFLRYPNGTKVFDSSFAVDVYRIFRDHLNFSEKGIEGEYVLEEHPRPGLDPMHVQLSKGTADIAITPTTIIEEKANLFQFLHPNTATWIHLHFANPPSMWRFFVVPFSTSVWLLTFVYCAVIVTVLSIFRRVLGKIYDRMDEMGTDSFELDVVWVLGSLCLQGWYDWPSSSTMRIAFLVSSVVGFLLNASYTGVLTSHLSVKIPPQKTLEKLLDTRYEFYLEEDLGFPIDFDAFPKWQGTKVSILEDMDAALEALRRIAKGEAAVISYPEYYFTVGIHGNYTPMQLCNLCTPINAGRIPTLDAMAVKKNSEFKELFNVLTLKLTEGGILRRLLRRYKRSKILTCETGTAVVSPQSLQQLLLPYVVLGIGWVLSLLILFGEIITARFRRERCNVEFCFAQYEVSRPPDCSSDNSPGTCIGRA